MIRAGRKLLPETYMSNKDEVETSLRKIYNHLSENSLLLFSLRKPSIVRPVTKLHGRYRLEMEIKHENRNTIARVFRIKKGNKTISRDVSMKLRFSKRDFDIIVKRVGFKIVGPDKTCSFYILKK
ncbi:hypothetical protein HYZ41_03155 [archaeon]|nr:hypothetical protein [archaeon]